ncbi:DUF2141 domain-containing protein [Sphingomonas sp. LHG3406-1]|uniref:DUF2141 domain-containing protein n=1 Tax=Sphingomonas sp. LHG3406-1 TaxID=2804617 RepID=UPI00261E7B90|nr:DUF2141 domain-containing protein [Sphingomonas sp. LHG3406-1]
MRTFLVAASMLALAACGGSTDTSNTAVTNDIAAVDTMITDDGMGNMTGNTAGNMAMGSGTVTVTINGVTPNGGPVLVALQGEGDFAKQAAAYSTRVDPTAATVTATISGVAPGSYAAAVVQDSNSDGTFTIGETGPAEPFGFSGSAQSGAPTFGPASFNVAESGGSATVTLKGK